MPRTTWMLLLTASLFCFCSGSSERADVPTPDPDGSYPALTGKDHDLSAIRLPAGFRISVFAEVDDARSMAVSPEGTLYIGNKDGDKVYAVRDTDGDFKADRKWVVASGLNMPNGVAFRDGDLYIAEVSRILRLRKIESRLSAPPKPEVVYDDFPTDTWHGWKYIAFGPDGKLYVPVGAPCNVCDKGESVYASITRMNTDGSGPEVFARGVRNSVGLTWHPRTNDLWFTDNGRDMLGDDLPPCELNRAPAAGMHFGFPFCHAGIVSDPEFGKGHPCTDYAPPAQRMGAHVAPLGLKFYTGKMFPDEYRDQLLVAEHGSWNRSRKNGYRVSLVRVREGRVEAYEPFASGWLDEKSQSVSGRPVDVLLWSDGSVLVSDDKRGVIYRISYSAR